MDDDQNLLAACRRQLRRRFVVKTALGPERGLESIQQNGPFAVVVSDMRMPVMDGVQFLTRVRALAPDTIRLMLTGHPDLQTAIDAVNEGNIFRFLTKPCPPAVLIGAIEASLKQRHLQRAQIELLETKLRHAQKMELMGQCAAGAFHELRNILATINARAHLALAALPDDPRLTGSLAQIQTAVGTAARLMQQLVDFSHRDKAAPFGPVSLTEVLTQLEETLRQLLPRNIAITCRCADHLPCVSGDAGALGQVLLNLAFNARDAMPQGGRLELQAEPAGGSSQGVSPSPTPWEHICLSISDNGCGMDPATRDRIFEPFFTTKQAGQGTGLGLAMVAEIVRQHQGRIEVHSTPGEGTTFRVLLPVWNQLAFPLHPDTQDASQEAYSVCG